MVSLAGYDDLIAIHDSENSQVYRARRMSDKPDGIATAYHRPVIIKFLNRDYPTPEQIGCISYL